MQVLAGLPPGLAWEHFFFFILKAQQLRGTSDLAKAKWGWEHRL